MMRTKNVSVFQRSVFSFFNSLFFSNSCTCSIISVSVSMSCSLVVSSPAIPILMRASAVFSLALVLWACCTAPVCCSTPSCSADQPLPAFQPLPAVQLLPVHVVSLAHAHPSVPGLPLLVMLVQAPLLKSTVPLISLILPSLGLLVDFRKHAGYIIWMASLTIGFTWTLNSVILVLMDEFLITLMRLRLNLMVEDLSVLFKQSCGKVIKTKACLSARTKWKEQSMSER